MNPKFKLDYDKPSAVMRSATINHFKEKYDTPTSYYQSHYQHYQQNNNGVTNKHAPLRSAKSLGSLTPVEPTNLLTDYDVSQIEIFFHANKSYVYVGRCLVNLYFTRTDLTNGGRSSKPRIHEWELSRTGVPVIIFDKGETKARDKRQLQICLAERGSGFVLWRDIIDNLSDYSAHHPCFHTLYLSCDHRKMAGLSFDSQIAAQQFHEQIETLTSDPLNIALTGPKKSNKKLRFLKKSSSSGGNNGGPIQKLPKKCDISSPCLFQHVTSVELCDYDRLYSMSTLVPYNNDIISSSSSSQSTGSSAMSNSLTPSSTPTSQSPSIFSSESNVSL